MSPNKWSYKHFTLSSLLGKAKRGKNLILIYSTEIKFDLKRNLSSRTWIYKYTPLPRNQRSSYRPVLDKNEPKLLIYPYNQNLLYLVGLIWNEMIIKNIKNIPSNSSNYKCMYLFLAWKPITTRHRFKWS